MLTTAHSLHLKCCSALLRQKPVHSTVDVLVYEDVVTLQSASVENLPGTLGCIAPRGHQVDKSCFAFKVDFHRWELCSMQDTLIQSISS